MKEVISVSVGELILKRGNRKHFENQLIERMRRALKGLNVDRIYKELAKIYVELPEENIEQGINRLKHVFGIVSISRVVRSAYDLDDPDKAMDIIEDGIDQALKREDTDSDFSFKIIASRAVKDFPIKSPELNQKLGGYVLRNYDKAKVDVHDPDIPVYVEVRDHIYITTHKEKALGGMPMGTNGKGLVLLSGGIDSPVAAFMIGRRGMTVDGLHFHSYPYTSKRAEQKVLTLADKVSRFTGPMKVYSINILNIQEAIKKNCQEKNNTILFRRFMMRIGKRYSEMYGYDAIITGDNLGQVASQTIDAMKIIDKTTNQLKIRPLISFDKEQIIKIAKEIDTYNTSIEPFDDSCTIFAPSRPNLQPTLEEILEEESKLDIEYLVEDAIKNGETITIE